MASDYVYRYVHTPFCLDTDALFTTRMDKTAEALHHDSQLDFVHKCTTSALSRSYKGECLHRTKTTVELQECRHTHTSVTMPY